MKGFLCIETEHVEDIPSLIALMQYMTKGLQEVFNELTLSIVRTPGPVQVHVMLFSPLQKQSLTFLGFLRALYLQMLTILETRPRFKRTVSYHE